MYKAMFLFKTLTVALCLLVQHWFKLPEIHLMHLLERPLVQRCDRDLHVDASDGAHAL